MPIEFKHYPVSVEHDGIVLEGVIVYWSKDYRVILKHPVYSEGSNLHMMYMIPARFVTPLDSKLESSVRDVDIVGDAKKKLKELYDNWKENQ